MSEREIHHRYEDPVDLIWRATANRLGMRIARSDEVFASWDGDRTLTISTPEHFDPDDCLAQMIFHEICHALVQGDAAMTTLDFGLTDEPVAEHACHRLQAALADAHGLRGFFAVTTEHRAHWDALPEDPLVGDERAVILARAALDRARESTWWAPIDDALAATAAIAATTLPFTGPDSLWARAKE